MILDDYGEKREQRWLVCSNCQRMQSYAAWPDSASETMPKWANAPCGATMNGLAGSFQKVCVGTWRPAKMLDE